MLSEENVADAGSRGVTLNQMESKDWYSGPGWLLNKSDWPSQPVLQQTSSVTVEEKPVKEIVAFANEGQPDEWDLLLSRRPYWGTLRITSWVLRFIHNSRAKKTGIEKLNGPLTTSEILYSRDVWIRKCSDIYLKTRSVAVGDWSGETRILRSRDVLEEFEAIHQFI